MVTRREEATPSRVHLTTYFDVAAGLCMAFLHKGLSITAAVDNIVSYGEVEGMIPGVAGADVETIASFNSCMNILERSVKLSLCFM